jgi:hypothetical protein
MSGVTRLLVVVTLVGFFVVAGARSSAGAQEAPFTLAQGQSVTLGQYTLVFRGVTGTLPTYELYVGAALAARFPSSVPPPNPAVYSYGNGSVAVTTTGVAPDGSTVSGILIAR